MSKLPFVIFLLAPLFTLTVSADTVLLKNAKIITSSELGILSKGDILIEDDKIIQVAQSISAPKQAKIIDLTGMTVTPGFINAESNLGIREISGGANASETSTNDASFTAAFNVADIVNPYSTAIPVARRGGVTSVIVAPSSNKHSHFSGQAAWYTLDDSNETAWIESAKGVFWDFRAVSEGRGATLPRLRAELANVATYARSKKSFSKEELHAKDWSIFDLDALVPVIKGKVPLAVRVNRATDISAIIDINSKYKTNPIIVGAAEGWMIASQLAAANIPVLIDPTANLPRNFDMLNAANDNAVLLYQAGVKLIIGGPTTAHDAGKLRYFAGIAVANGLPYEAAIQAITVNVADVWGLANVGQLSPGKRADIAIWDGDPLEPITQINGLYIAGKLQSLETRQDKLEQNYIPEATNVYANGSIK
ncbi:MAG: amidohydrolase family protein [Paraglaciecola sp.]|uniref:amidohydrolase family protein n=1 Tax=Paraglaciecola sp. TaxID=1920173 RepID=UPI003299E23B